MTQEEARKILKDFHDNSALFSVRTALETLHPELKESEDEKIRKVLVELVKCNERCGYFMINNITTSAMLAWLEKQGTPNQTSIWKHWKDGIAGNGEGELIYLVKYGHTYSLSSCLCFECDYIELSELDKLMLEKQGEQKPLFKVGDKIRTKDAPEFTYTILEIKDGDYICNTCDFGIDNPNLELVEE